MIEINGVNVPFIPSTGIDNFKSTKAIQSKTNGTTPFKEILNQELKNIKFSGHAIERLNSREINLAKKDIERLEAAISKAEEKNSKDSLVLIDEKAFIINIPNRTVVTMLTKDKLEEKIITKIDSTVFA